MITVTIYHQEQLRGCSYDIWNARLNDNGSVDLLTDLNGNFVTVNVNDKVQLHIEGWEEVIEKMYNVGYLKNLVEDINYEIRTSVWALQHDELLINFNKINEICRPAYHINALSLDQRNKCIYSQGENSFTHKVYGSTERRVDMIKTVNINNMDVVVFGDYGGYDGNESVQFLTIQNVEQFVRRINEVFTD